MASFVLLCCTYPNCHCTVHPHLPEAPNVLPQMFVARDRKTIIIRSWGRKGEDKGNGKKEVFVITGRRSETGMEEEGKEKRKTDMVYKLKS